MTKPTRKLLNEFERELETLSEEEQNRRMVPYREDLCQNDEAEQAQDDAYSALKILRDASLRGPTQASVSYEKGLPEPKKRRSHLDMTTLMKTLTDQLRALPEGEAHRCRSRFSVEAPASGAHGSAPAPQSQPMRARPLRQGTGSASGTDK